METIVSIYEKEDPEYEYEDLPDRSGKKKKEKGTDYCKVAKAIGSIRSHGINLSLININTSDYGFKPDIAHNRILYGMKSLSNINAETIEKIKAGRPYTGIKDFMTRCPLTKTAMINLIKAGAFDEIDIDFNSRKDIMTYYINNICDAKKRITMQNFGGLISYNLVPKEFELEVRIFNFNKYLKSLKKGDYFVFDVSCNEFFNNFLSDYVDNLEIINGQTCIKQTTWKKIYDRFMANVKTKWITPNHDAILKEYNGVLFAEVWDKYAAGTQSKWEMDSLSFYHSPHELIDVDPNKYGLSNFGSIKSEDIDYFFKKSGRDIPIYKLYRIAGTVIAKDDSKHCIYLLDTNGEVVNVKMTGDYYSMFKRQISSIGADNKKTVIEKSWFKKGEKLMCQGYRREDQFVLKNYRNSGGHELYHIDEVVGDSLKIRHDRYSGKDAIEEEEYE